MYDKEAAYKKLIEDKVEELISLCNGQEIPCFLMFATKQNENDELICNGKSLLPETLGIDTKDQLFSNLVNVRNGFSTTPPSYAEVISIDDFQFPE